MKRSHVLLLLVLLVLAGALLLSPKHDRPVSEPPPSNAAPSKTREAEVQPPDRGSAAPAKKAPQPSDAVTLPPAAPAPPDGAALREEADRLISEGQVIEGLEVFRKAVEADPSAKNHGDLGALLYRLTAFDEAAIHLRAAAELDPGNADRWIALANVYYRKVDLGEAWKAEKRAREAEPGLELGRDGGGMRVRKGSSALPNR